jgi:hypothetical protein
MIWQRDENAAANMYYRTLAALEAAKQVRVASTRPLRVGCSCETLRMSRR